jgi:hypothetical protein
MTKLLGLQDILAAQDIATEDVAVPEWGGTVRVRGLTGRERDEYESHLLDQRGKRMKVDMRDARARLVALSVIDAEGKPVFTAAHVETLGTKSAAALDRIYDVAARLSGISDEDMDELTGNSAATASAASRSGSPKSSA